MTKWGMPGVYTHAFMDGWSPGYLGSVAYNHNGMMRMYETQSGREADRRPVPARRRRLGDAAARRRGSAVRTRSRRLRPDADARATRRRLRPTNAADAAASRAAARAGAVARRTRGWRSAALRLRAASRGAAPAQAGGRGGPAAAAVRHPTGRGGGQPREWYRGIPIPPDAVANFSRRNNTNYMQTGVLSALQLTSMFPNLVLENFYMKTQQLDRRGQERGAVRLRDSRCSAT